MSTIIKNNRITEEFLAHMRKNGGKASDWYVGVSSDVKNRLFNDHKVREQYDSWIYSKVISDHEARNIEKYFIDEYGTDGGPGGGKDMVNRVYAYKKAYHTNP